MMFAVLLTVAGAKDAGAPELMLPPVVYAVQGLPTDIFFANTVRSEDATALRFRVDCELGQSRSDRWHLDPKRRDIGDHPLRIELLDEDGRIAESEETLLRISSASAGEKQTIKLLLIGDSLTQANLYPAALRMRLLAERNPEIEMLGSNAPLGFPGVRHEGYAGWGWRQFTSRYRDEPHDAAYPQRGSSPFVRRGEEVALDIHRYQLLRLDGETPDIIVVALGVNDCFKASVDPVASIDRCIDGMLEEADSLTNALQTQFPDAQIGISLAPPPNARYGAFASNYRDDRTRAEYLMIRHRVVQREMEHYGGAGVGVAVFPIGLNLDTVAGFPANNALHPNKLGYSQMADSVYAWIKAELTRRDERVVP